MNRWGEPFSTELARPQEQMNDDADEGVRFARARAGRQDQIAAEREQIFHASHPSSATLLTPRQASSACGPAGMVKRGLRQPPSKSQWRHAAGELGRGTTMPRRTA